MKFLRTLEVPWFAEQPDLTRTDAGYYADKERAYVAYEFVLEEDDDDQYPMEDVLDEFGVFVKAFNAAPSNEPEGSIHVFAGKPSNVERMMNELTGKRAYNVEYDDGVELVIE